MMRRTKVPAVAPAMTGHVAARLESMLQGHVSPAYDPKLQAIAGVWWPRPERRVTVAMQGDVAMFDVDEPGELQEWEPRGVAHG